MTLIFKSETHSYTSLNPDELIEWTSVTKFVSLFKDKFDTIKIAAKSSKNKRSKWHGISPEEIQQIWANEAKRATDLGTWYHNQRESDITGIDTIERQGIAIPIIKPIIQDGVKFAPDQKLTEGIYPEHLVYLKSAALCGQSDLVEVIKNTVNIIDYKTNKEIKTESYKNWEGISEKMLEPVSNLEDCNFNHYALQLSIYMYMILKHNPRLLAGTIFIHHITFEVEGKDDWGYPIAKRDEYGDPIVKEVTPMLVPYLYDEVIAIINHMKENPTFIKKK